MIYGQKPKEKDVPIEENINRVALDSKVASTVEEAISVLRYVLLFYSNIHFIKEWIFCKAIGMDLKNN